MRFTAIAVIAAASVALASGGLVQAGQLDKELLPPNPQYVIHVDVEAFAASAIGELLLSGDLDLGLQDACETVIQETGMDPFEVIKGITVYDYGDDLEEGVAVISASSAIDQLIAGMADQAEEMEGYSSLEEGGRILHIWTEDTGMDVVGCVVPRGEDRLVVISQKPEFVIAAADVIDGKAPGFTDVGSSDVDLRPSKGSLVYINVDSLEFLPEIEPASEILQQAQGIVFELSETDQKLRAELQVEAESSDEAQNITDVMNGMIAMGRMIASEDPDLAIACDLARFLKIDHKGERIMASVQLDMGMIEMILKEQCGDSEPKAAGGE